MHGCIYCTVCMYMYACMYVCALMLYVVIYKRALSFLVKYLNASLRYLVAKVVMYRVGL